MLKMFGRSYSQIGDSNSDFLIKTKGLVKILWGSKFIDLIKDGKINVDSKFIYKSSSVGVKDGIYVIEENGLIEVYLKIGNLEPISLIGETGNSYVSFLAPLETTSELKYLALQNIGFIYPNLDSLDNVENGIVYIESELKLYIIKNGSVEEFTIPMPYKGQFIIEKSDNSEGAIIIKGYGSSNSIKFDSFLIYNDLNRTVLESDNTIHIIVNDATVSKINQSLIEFYREVIAPSFTSNTFRVYNSGGKSTLEVDKLILKEQITNKTLLYPEIWLNSVNVVTSYSLNDDNTILYLQNPNTFSVGDTLLMYDGTEVTVLESYEDNIVVTLTEVTNNSLIFKVDDSIRITKNIDIVESKTVTSRIGDLTDIGLSGKGIYSSLGYFDNAQYTKDLPLEDNSSKFASTAWVKSNINSNFVSGMIILFYGTTIPDGWLECNGQNNTPNIPAIEGAVYIMKS